MGCKIGAEQIEERAVDVLTYAETRTKGEAVVMVSLADWNAREEMLHLFSTPANAKRLRASIRALDAGMVRERAVLEE